jgi:hypothetical protein
MNDGSGWSTAFNGSAWRDASCGYTISLKEKSIKEITQAAKQIVKCAHCHGRASTISTDSMNDVHTNLVKESDDEECKSN